MTTLKGTLKTEKGEITGTFKEVRKATRDEKQKKDEAISIVWEVKRRDWTMDDLAMIFGMHKDTIWSILKEARIKKILSR